VMEAAGLSVRSVHVYQTIRRQIPQDSFKLENVRAAATSPIVTRLMNDASSFAFVCA
jgi:hypothetical protein